MAAGSKIIKGVFGALKDIDNSEVSGKASENIDLELDEIEWSYLDPEEVFDMVKGLFGLNDANAVDLIDKTGYFTNQIHNKYDGQILTDFIKTHGIDSPKSKENLLSEIEDAMVSVDDESTNQTFLDFFEDAANIVGGE
tara:strand:- start:92 stop:508 length:417 start_codon:yes stop_codon:yes gene_type:complete